MFIPVFLVSVGLILDPAVMVEGETLKLAALFLLVCLGGKVLAAMISALVLGFSRPQGELLFSLSVAQAAATLAATVIGFQLGLFGSSVVNAVLVVILVTVVISTIVGTRASKRLTAQAHGPRPLGTRVMVGIGDPELAWGALSIAVAVARADGGFARSCARVPESRSIARTRARSASGGLSPTTASRACPRLIVDRSVLHGALRAGAAAEVQR